MIEYAYLNDEATAIYLNFPFCKLPCTYCHYVSNIKFGYETIPEDYFFLLTMQLEKVLKNLHGRQMDSIYFGGGTPSLLTDKQIAMIEGLFEKYNVSSLEVSMEIHPGMCNFDFVNNKFFTRYSIGIQTLCRETAERYHRTTYSVETITDMIEKIRGAAYPKIINVDFLFDQEVKEEEILYVNQMQPETVTFYPNTKGRGADRLRNVLLTLKNIEELLEGYSPLGKSKYIYIRKNCRQSFYSKCEYEKYGNILGVGHNSVSFIGNNSYLCLYDGNEISTKSRNYRGERLLSALLMGIATGVTKKQVNQIMPEIYCSHFLLTVKGDIDVCDKHISVDDNDLVYLPETEYIRFYEFISGNYLEIYQKIFLASIGYGDSDIETIRQIYNLEFVTYQDGAAQIQKKIKTPQLRILVEGIDGSGKDTFVRYFANELKRCFLYSKDSRISITGQPDSTCDMGKEAKKFVEELAAEGDKQSIITVLQKNRWASEKKIATLSGIVILIRGIVTDKATFSYKYGEVEDLGEGRIIPKWDKYIVVDIDPAKADQQIESRGIPRTWRERSENLEYFRNFYLQYKDDLFIDKIIIHNNRDIEALKIKAVEMAKELYEQYRKQKYDG
ncbi:hypothetical protein D3Z55_04780 [Clostridiaceae bacterium]|nr:hypothetical protein [Clostridiaceae bacterium]